MSMHTGIPVISPAELQQRRARLMAGLGEQAVAVVRASGHRIRNRDAEYAFRQDSDFLYLTGFNEADAVAVLLPGRPEGEFVLFCLDKNPAMERWTGIRAGVEGAKAQYGADQAFPLSELDKRMPALFKGRDEIHCHLGANPEHDRHLIGWLNTLRQQTRGGVIPPSRVIMLERLLHQQRLIKSEAEIAMMQHAATTSARAHTRAMAACRPGRFEYEIEAVLLGEFRRDGMEPAYTSIVGGGENACILHYVTNRSELKDGDLLLIDAAGEHEGYASDITRTFPVNGRFSPEQRALYQLVLDAQKAAIAEAKPGNHWNQPHEAAVRVLVGGLVALGLLQGEVDELVRDPEPVEGEEKPKEAAYRQFYMHRTGHWLGLDVHDVGDYKVNGQWRTLEPGMVLTVEPGLYVSPTDNVDPRWWNIGIRIEDDVLITSEGNRVLTAAVVKEIDAIEALMQRGGD